MDLPSRRLINHFKATIAYDGSSYFGWQTQVDGNTVQDVLIRVLEQIAQSPIKILGASRTDSGVHAWRQVAKISLTKNIQLRNIFNGMNSLLPDSIRVLELEKCSEDFCPVRDSTGKIYRYSLWKEHKCLNPFLSGYVWPLQPHVRAEELARLFKLFIGRKNFKSFCASNSSAITFERRIFDIQVFEHAHSIDIWVLGEGFLKQMIRNIVGTVVEQWDKPGGSSNIEQIFEGEDRTLAGKTAPARGLTLVDVLYEPIEQNLIKLLKSKNYDFFVPNGVWRKH